MTQRAHETAEKTEPAPIAPEAPALHDVAEVRGGLECGVLLTDTNDIKAGDQLEVFEVEMRDRTL